MDTQELIQEHIGDAYSWHITTVNGHPIQVYLPVIVYSRQTGWHVFSSHRIENGFSYQGFKVGPKGKVVEELPDGSEARPFDISITKNVTGLFMVTLLVIWMTLHCARWYKKHPLQSPGGFVGMMELVTNYIYENVIQAVVGKQAVRFAPYLLTAFYFILVCNLMGLIPFFPFGFNLTGNIAITVTLAIATFLVVNLTANRHYWKDILWPNVPWFLKVPIPLMPFIEIVGMFTKPFSLTIRLLANIMAGHIIIMSIVCLIFTSVAMGAAMHNGITALAIVMAIFMNVMELLVAFLQAFVFTTLSASYIGAAQAEPEDE